jgi:hypothetical protein
VAAGLRTTVLLLAGVLLVAGLATTAALVVVNRQAEDIRARWSPLDTANDELRALAAEAYSDLQVDIVAAGPDVEAHVEATARSFAARADEAVDLAGDDDEVVASIEEQRTYF